MTVCLYKCKNLEGYTFIHMCICKHRFKNMYLYMQTYTYLYVHKQAYGLVSNVLQIFLSESCELKISFLHFFGRRFNIYPLGHTNSLFLKYLKPSCFLSAL